MYSKLMRSRNVLTVETHSPPSSSASELYQIYKSRIMDVHAVLLKPPSASQLPTEDPLPTFTDLNFSDPDLRISRLSREKVEVWAKTVMADMFHAAGKSKRALISG
jgi:hypothetical protein